MTKISVLKKDAECVRLREKWQLLWDTLEKHKQLGLGVKDILDLMQTLDQHETEDAASFEQDFKL